jgi:hypothetical protein
MGESSADARLAVPGRLRRLAMSVLALVIVYGNLSVTFNARRAGLGWLPRIPCPIAVRDAFLIPGMFGSFVPLNFDCVVQGQLATPGGGLERDRWVTLSITEYFPLRASMTLVHMLAAHHRDMLGASGQRAAWAHYADKIRARHNRLHPEARIARVRIGAESFPQSPDGYRAAKSAAATSFQIWFEQP